MASETVTGRTSAPRRRFTLLDGMILVAATAVGYAVAHAFARGFKVNLLGSLREVATEGNYLGVAFMLFLIALPVLAGCTVALIPLRLLKPRPRFRRLARQPGLMAGIAVTMAIGVVGLLVGIIFAIGGGIIDVTELVAIILLPTFIGLAVAVAWATLIVGRRWRPEPTWIDRLGRALGAFWVLLGLASPFALLYL